MSDAKVAEIAKKHSKTPAQVVLNYLVRHTDSFNSIA